MNVFSNDNILPLEIWHGQTAKGPLFQCAPDERARLAAEFIREIHKGSALTLNERDTGELVLAQGFTRLCLCGGGARDVYRELQSDKEFSVEIYKEPTALESYDLTVDWGQSRIKIFHREGVMSIERDKVRFPVRCSWESRDSEKVDLSSSRKNISQFFVEILSQFPDTRSLALALPVRICPQDIFAEPSTYEGLEGSLLDVFESALLEKLSLEKFTVMNDAVFSALNVPPRGEKTLVVTVGYGVGAALWKK